MFHETLFSRHERVFVVIGAVVLSVLISIGLFALTAVLVV